MKATGIVRRIDDLGRVVIPKEIRRTMRIREGDPLEIYTNSGGEVIFKKYSPIGELSVFASQYADAISRSSKAGVIICDREHCVAAAGVSKKDTIEARITKEVEEITENRKTYIALNGEVRKALEGLDNEILVACPIISAGDISGTVILLKNEQISTPSDSDIKLCEVAAVFLGKQMEE